MADLKPNTFFIGDDVQTPVQGFEIPKNNWNGWAIPLVNLENLKKIQKELEDNMAGTISLNIIDGVAFYIDESMDEEFGVHTIQHNDETLYEVGFGWTWESKQ